MKATVNFSEISQDIIKKEALMIIFVDPSVLTPSDSLIKFITLNPIAQEMANHIYVYKGT